MWAEGTHVSREPATSDVSPEEMRALCARLGLSPSDEELSAMALGVQRLSENDRLVRGMFAPGVEPATAPHPRPV